MDKLTYAELEELLNGIETQQEPTEELIPTQIEIPMQEKQNNSCSDIFRKFLRFALHPKGAYKDLNGELQPNYENNQPMDSVRANYL